MSLPTSVTARSLLDIWFTEALGCLLVTDPLRGAPEVAVAGLTVRVCEGAVAAVVTFPCQTTATKLHATLLLRSALGAPQSQAVCVRANGFASPTAAGARDGSRIHIHFVA